MAWRRRPDTSRLGRAAEAVAARWLVRQGFEILEQNYRTSVGEIDVIAREEETLCFIEVKSRRSRAYGPPEAAVDRRRRLRLVRAASLYLARHERRTGRGQPPCRFDVLALEAGTSGWTYRLLRDAFQADD